MVQICDSHLYLYFLQSGLIFMHLEDQP